MGDRVRRLTAREVEKMLSAFGFEIISHKGSRREWHIAVTRRQMIWPSHSGRALSIGTTRNILTNAEIPGSEWRNR